MWSVRRHQNDHSVLIFGLDQNPPVLHPNQVFTSSKPEEGSLHPRYTRFAPYNHWENTNSRKNQLQSGSPRDSLQA